MAKLPGWKEMMETLVALPSISSANPDLDCSNKPVVDHLAQWLDGLGFSCEIRPLEEQPHKYNLVATLYPDGGEGPAGLALCGHTDTVPYDETGWDSDPFTLSERAGCLFGLGSCDMKGFLALAAAAAGRIDPGQLRRPLAIIATADEESGMDGAQALAEGGSAPADCAVIGEPTGLIPVRSHKGILMESLRVTGSAGHSRNPALGLNAIEGMQRVIAALLAFRDELKAGPTSQTFTVPHTTMNLGQIRGGDSANRIPAECELHVDTRFLPGIALQELRDELRAQAERALQGTQFALECHPLFAGSPAFDTPADAGIVASAEAATGRDAAAVDFATEGAFFNQMGMETVILGPGHIDHAHQANEYLALAFIEPTLTALEKLIRHHCLPRCCSLCG